MIGVALKYLPDEDLAPRIVASGEGLFGSKILELARIHKVPVVKDSNLAKSLVQLPVGEEIPENLYKAVAAVFSFIYNLENELN
jgi:FlhB-like protein